MAPKTGCVRVIKLTEKQYNNISIVTGGADYQEETVIEFIDGQTVEFKRIEIIRRDEP